MNGYSVVKELWEVKKERPLTLFAAEREVCTPLFQKFF